jgi:hypothetical protein
MKEIGRHYTDEVIIGKLARLSCFFKVGHGTNVACAECIEDVKKSLQRDNISPELIEDMAVTLLNAKDVFSDTRPSATNLEYSLNVLRNIIPTLRDKFTIEMENQMSDTHIEDLEAIKSKVVSLLITRHDMLVEEAETVVEESMKHASMWHENTNPEELAEFLAEEDDDE